MESQKQEGAFQTSVAKRWNNVAVKFQQSLIEQEIKKKTNWKWQHPKYGVIFSKFNLDP